MPESTQNNMGTKGFGFVEYSASDVSGLRKLFEAMGFAHVASHKSRDITLYRQGEIAFVVNGEEGSFAKGFADAHGPSASAMAFRVEDAEVAYVKALELGAKPVDFAQPGGEYGVPAIEGIGGSRLYLIDEKRANPFSEFEFVASGESRADCGLFEIDHLTHNVQRGQMDVWAGFYERIFGFREIRYFDIEGKVTGLSSRAMVSPCGKLRIPINESHDDQSQIEEYLHEYKGEGIQHIALASGDICKSVDLLVEAGTIFLDTPDTYYELVDQRLPGHGEDVEALASRRILIDGETDDSKRLLLQIFTANVIGPIFFEIIQRKGNEGFGEGNFQALFESIELDQIRRGVIDDTKAA